MSTGASVRRSVKDILLGAIKRLRRAGGWIQNDFAKSKAGRVVDERSRRAVCWCVAGAITAEARGNEDLKLAVRRAVDQVLLASEGYTGLTLYNDTPGRKKSEVLGLLRAAVRQVS